MNGVVLSPDEEMELDPGETTIYVVFMGGVAPDLLSDIYIAVDGSDDSTTLQCNNTRNCTQTVCRCSRTLGQCLNATNISGKNAYRTFCKYLQVSFQFGLRTQPTLNFNNNIGECLYSVRCYRSVRENAYGIVFRAVCVFTGTSRHLIPPVSRIYSQNCLT